MLHILYSHLPPKYPEESLMANKPSGLRRFSETLPQGILYHSFHIILQKREIFMKIFFKNHRRLFLSTMIFGYILLLFFFPSICISGAKEGLLLWFEQLLPSLLPFLILSGLCVRFGLTELIGKLFYPFLRFLPVSQNGCYPIIIGLLSGYPVGAKTCADMLMDKKLKHHEASFLMCCCNNASPMFLTGFVSCSCLGLPEYRYIIFLIIAVSGILSAWLLSPIFRKNISNTTKHDFYGSHISKDNTTAPIPSETATYADSKRTTGISTATAMQKLDETILSSFEVMVKVGGYIILFSIPAALLSHIFSHLISGSPGISILPLYTILGILEISTGTASIGNSALPLLIKTVLTLSICAFGGFSALAQTKSVIGSSGLSIKHYIIAKLLQAIIAGSTGWFVFSMLRI